MAGSRKGERRGGRKAGVEPKPRTPKVKAETPREKHYDKNRNAPRRTEEYYREITRAMDPNAAAAIEPREVMLEAMRYFHGKAMDERAMIQGLVQQLPAIPADSPQWPAVNSMLQEAEGRAERQHVLAADMAFKVAPYVHAKLSSVEFTGKDGAPIDIIHTLLVDITKAASGSPSWMQEADGKLIEHSPHIGEEE